jgi:organic hydroperoxide reductase OsmC/OhrA
MSGIFGSGLLPLTHVDIPTKMRAMAKTHDLTAEGETGLRGEGRFVRAVLRPTIRVERGADLVKADALHDAVHELCFIARSVNFPISFEARYVEV